MKSIFILTILSLASSVGKAASADDIIVWKYKTKTGIVSAPVIHEGTIYVGSLDDHLYALDALTGALKWQYDTEEQIRSNAALFENGICFESGNQLFALNFQGDLLWSFPLYSDKMHNQYDSWNYFHSSPNIVDGIAYIGTEMGLVYGIDINDGTQTFFCQTGNEHGIRVMPAVYNNQIYFGDWNGVAYAYNLEDGEQVWQYDTKDDNTYSWMNAIQTRMVIYQGVLYFAGRSCNIYAMNPDDGTSIWEWHSPTDEWIVGGPIIKDDILYIGSSNQHLFYGFNTQTGELIFQSLLDYRVFGGALIDDLYAYVGSGSFYSVDKMTGEIMKKLPMERDIVSVPILSDGVLYFGCNDGHLFAVDQSKFGQMLMSNTFPEEETEIDLGNVPTDQIRTFEITLFNTGEGDDSISVSILGNTKVKKALTSNLENFILSAGDSAKLIIELNPSDLKPDEYSMNLKIHSQYNLDNNDFTIPLTLNIVESTDIGKNGTPLPGSFTLDQNYPNPFNPVTQIRYSLPCPSVVHLGVYDSLGRIVTKLFEGLQPAGEYTIPFNGSEYSSGIYFCVLDADGTISHRKMILLK